MTTTFKPASATKTIAILQSNYVPWKGYFDIIAKSDVFVLYDEVQFTKNDWRNRNLIKSSSGSQWLTIPVQHRNSSQRIAETETSNSHWIRKHQMALEINYAKAPCFKKMRDHVFDLYPSQESNLSRINEGLLRGICEILGIKTTIIRSDDLHLEGNRVHKLVDACQKLGATNYLSGESAKNYLHEDDFCFHGIKLEWMDYSRYPVYTQIHPPFDHNVSILDLIFHCGEDAGAYLKYVNF